MDENDAIERLTENVRQELQAQNAIAHLGLSDEVMDGLAHSIAVNIDCAFETRWAPSGKVVGVLSPTRTPSLSMPA